MKNINLFKHNIPEFGEDFYTLLEHHSIKISKIISSDKLEDKEYCQEEDEFVALLEGEAVLIIDEKKLTLKKGDTLFIPAYTKHKILKTKKGTIWLAIYIKN